jgi:hypothetical protein
VTTASAVSAKTRVWKDAIKTFAIFFLIASAVQALLYLFGYVWAFALLAAVLTIVFV